MYDTPGRLNCRGTIQRIDWKIWITRRILKHNRKYFNPLVSGPGRFELLKVWRSKISLYCPFNKFLTDCIWFDLPSNTARFETAAQCSVGVVVNTEHVWGQICYWYWCLFCQTVLSSSPLLHGPGSGPGQFATQEGGSFFLYYFPLKVIYCILHSSFRQLFMWFLLALDNFLQGLPNTFFLNKHKHNKKEDISFDHQ